MSECIIIDVRDTGVKQEISMLQNDVETSLFGLESDSLEMYTG